MTSKNDPLSTSQLSEISTIRNILMGQQMSEYETHFARFEQQVADDRAHFTQELAAFSSQTGEHFQRLEKDMNDRFDRLEKLLADHVARLDQKLQQVSKNDKSKLGKMLADMSQKLIQE